MLDDNTLFFLGTLVPTIVGGVGLFESIYAYREGQLLKRKDLIIPLIDEFDNSEDIFLAKAILDDFTCNIPPSGANNQLLKKFSQLSKDELEFYNKSNLKKFLRYHRDLGVEPVISVEERTVRRSFDSLINFFFKLQYLYRTGLLREKELYYFRYYMTLAFDDEDDLGTWNYIEKYKLPLERKFVEHVTNLTEGVFISSDASKIRLFEIFRNKISVLQF